MALRLTINGNERELADLHAGSTVSALVEALGFRPDRIALEQNGKIVPRTTWLETGLAQNDRLEVVHFVGGGSGARIIPHR